MSQQVVLVLMASLLASSLGDVVREVVTRALQDMYSEDTPRNYDQKPLYLRSSPSSQKASLHNRIIKKSVAQVIRERGVGLEEAFNLVQSEMFSMFGGHHRPKPGGFPCPKPFGTGPRPVVTLPLLPPVTCSTVDNITCPNQPSRYYSVDGSCNNQIRTDWGATNTPFRRLVSPSYEASSSPRVTNLPLARVVSTTVHQGIERQDLGLSHMVAHWGQFLDHDITLTPEQELDCECGPDQEEDCFNIEIPADDSFHSQFSPPQTCLHFTRSSTLCSGDSTTREQFNAITAFIDGSNIYGSDQTTADLLREFSEGELTTSLDHPGQLLPVIGGSHLAGDVRATEQPGLTSLHTLWMREHNRIVKEIAGWTPGLSDEELFQEGRRRVVAELQNIVYSEWLPVILGPSMMDKYKLSVDSRSTYDPNMDPSIVNSFATAAFRFGHSLIQGLVDMVSDSGSSSQYNLRHNFFNDTLYLQDGGEGMEELLRGLLRQNTQQFDTTATEDLTNFLFQEEGDNFGSDLMARNIQRGRDHGLPGYASYRQVCGMDTLQGFEPSSRPVEIPEQTWTEISGIYNQVEDIDLITGGLAETPLPGAVVGPTFGCIIGQQFQRLRFGDRLFFTHEGVLSDSEWSLIKSRSLRDVLCDNTDIEEIQTDVFSMNSEVQTCHARTAQPPDCSCDVEAFRAEVIAEFKSDVTAMETRLSPVSEVVERIANPDVFSCKRMGGWSDETIPVPYTGCDVHLPSDLVDIGTGKFTVQTDGVYRLTFTSRMSAMDGQTIRADLYVNGVLIGRAVNALDTFDSTTNTSMPFTSDLETTSTLDQLYELSAGDEVYMMIDYVGSMSLIQSSSKYQIFFTGDWIRDTTDTDLVSGTPTTTPAPTPAPRVTTVAPEETECMTVSGNTPNLPCVFPFTFDGVSYSSCIVEGFPNPWCSTETDSQGKHVTGKWGDCDLDNCPVA